MSSSHVEQPSIQQGQGPILLGTYCSHSGHDCAAKSAGVIASISDDGRIDERDWSNDEETAPAASGVMTVAVLHKT